MRISKETGLVQQDVFDVIQKTLDYITEALSKGQDVELRNFGVKILGRSLWCLGIRYGCSFLNLSYTVLPSSGMTIFLIPHCLTPFILSTSHALCGSLSTTVLYSVWIGST